MAVEEKIEEKIKSPRSVLKLGGSVITVKGDPALILRKKELERIAKEVASVHITLRPLVLVHGAGSFGHQIVARTRIHEKVESEHDRLAWAETQILQNELNAMVCRIFLNKGVPAVPYQASSSGWMLNGKLHSIELRPLRNLVKQGLMPVLYGVPAVEETGGCRILSGDTLTVAAAQFVNASLIFYGTDVDGVFKENPTKNPDSKKWEKISQKNWNHVKQGLTGSSNTDVTGGMAGKVHEALQLSRKGISARIFDATMEGSVTSVLEGEPLGTEITW